MSAPTNLEIQICNIPTTNLVVNIEVGKGDLSLASYIADYGRFMAGVSPDENCIARDLQTGAVALLGASEVGFETPGGQTVFIVPGSNLQEQLSVLTTSAGSVLAASSYPDCGYDSGPTGNCYGAGSGCPFGSQGLGEEVVA